MPQSIHLNIHPPFFQNTLSPLELATLDELERPYHHVARTDLIEVLMQGQPEFVPKRILDIGCNTGATGEYLKNRFPNCFVVGVEPHAPSAQIAKEHLDLVIETPLEAIDWPEYSLPFSKFDLVLLPDVLEHMYNPWQTMTYIKTLIDDESMVAASIPNFRSILVLLALACGELPYGKDGLLDATHIRFFTLSSAFQLFTGLGYRVLHATAKPFNSLSQLIQKNEPQPIDIVTPYLTLHRQTLQQRQELATCQFLMVAQFKSNHD